MRHQIAVGLHALRHQRQHRLAVVHRFDFVLGVPQLNTRLAARQRKHGIRRAPTILLDRNVQLVHGIVAGQAYQPARFDRLRDKVHAERYLLLGAVGQREEVREPHLCAIQRVAVDAHAEQRDTHLPDVHRAKPELVIVDTFIVDGQRPADDIPIIKRNRSAVLEGDRACNAVLQYAARHRLPVQVGNRIHRAPSLQLVEVERQRPERQIVPVVDFLRLDIAHPRFDFTLAVRQRIINPKRSDGGKRSRHFAQAFGFHAIVRHRSREFTAPHDFDRCPAVLGFVFIRNIAPVERERALRVDKIHAVRADEFIHLSALPSAVLPAVLHPL